MPGYRKPGKEPAYEYLLEVAVTLSDDRINSRMPFQTHELKNDAFHKFGISGRDFDDIATKAARVERERRHGKGPATIQMLIRLHSNDRSLVADLADRYGVSEVQAVRMAIRRLHESRV